MRDAAVRDQEYGLAPYGRAKLPRDAPLVVVTEYNGRVVCCQLVFEGNIARY
jgi:hypothetical protein